jgi:hypothetical protein
MHIVKWDDFLANIAGAIDVALEKSQRTEDFDIEKQILDETGVLGG